MKNGKLFRMKTALGFLLVVLFVAVLSGVIWLENFAAFVPNIAGVFLFAGLCLLEWYLIDLIYFPMEKEKQGDGKACDEAKQKQS